MSKETPPSTKDETLDLFNLLDCVILKVNFRARAPVKNTEQETILATNINRILGELKTKSILTPISSLVRLAILKDRKKEVEDYLLEEKKRLAELLSVDPLELDTLASFNWSWVWFSYASLRNGSEAKKRYEENTAQVFVELLEGILGSLQKCEDNNQGMKLKDKELLINNILMPTLEELQIISGPDNKERLVKFTELLLQVKSNVKDATATKATATGFEIVNEVQKRIVTTKKAPRNVELYD